MIIFSKERRLKKCESWVAESDIVVIPRWGSREYNRVYDKFCIIGIDYVMHGSYNWTSKANDSEEILATTLDHELIAKFAKEFMELYNGIYFKQWQISVAGGQ